MMLLKNHISRKNNFVGGQIVDFITVLIARVPKNNTRLSTELEFLAMRFRCGNKA